MQLQWRRGPYRATSVDGFATAVAQQIEDAIVVGDSEGDIYEDQSVDIDDFILLQQWKETAGIQ